MVRAKIRFRKPSELEKYRSLEKRQQRGRIILKEVARRRSIGGRIGAFFQGVARVGRQGVTKSLYAPSNLRQARINQAMGSGARVSYGSKTIKSFGTGRRGRPSGSFDPRYAKYGGVYGYRKYLATQLRIQRMEALRRATINPQQQAVLNQIERREQLRRMNPENKAIPDTSGTIFMADIQKDINNAVNLVD
jgi:hypothetical protein